MASTCEVPTKARGGKFSQWVSKQVVDEQVPSISPSTPPALYPSDEPMQKEPLALKPMAEDEEEAFRQYMDKIGENRDGTSAGFNRKAFPWFTPKEPAKAPTVSAEVLEAAMEFKPKPRTSPKLWEVDSEGEEVPLCPRCSLPVGEFAYQGREGKQTCVHTECMAQVMSQEAQREEDARVKRENVKKEKNRREYDIGWRMDSVPKSAQWAERMGCKPAPQGLCCLVLDEASRTVKVAATAEPSAAVNLEYLLLALKVRKTASREPLFSLDPVDPQNLEKTPQKKVYEPSWLAGTSVGDVMFQADYFLKELALGEYDMPVVGMLSVFDWSEMKDKDKSWAGREWYVVKKAEIRMAEDNTLIPHVKMGVEAREQVVTKKGLEDAPVTLPHHPLKKFADAFTRNFDLIAERKSVVFHLRELAKASAMAKYLIDSKARLDPTWYVLADEIVKSTEPEAYPQIPQLWNMRGNSRIKLKEGRLVDMVTGGQSNLQAIYGGVEFGLDRFELAQRHALQGQKPSVPGVQLAQSGRPMFMPQRFQLGQRPEMPQGVDLNLDKFSLSTEERFAGRLPPCSGGVGSLEAKTVLGRAFLQALQQKSFAVKPEDQSLLLNIFKVPQCDRVEEGDAFIPPDPNLEYLTKVRSLVGEEKTLRERRKQRFSDKSFAVANPGLDFPRSWTPRFQVELEGRVSQTAPTKFGLKKLEVDEAFKRGLLENVLPAAAPEFNQVTEDGIVFRIYKIGSLEVRTMQEADEPEAIAVVFSSGTASWEGKAVDSEDVLRDRLVKCKVYVEAMEQESQLHLAKDARTGCNFYIVLETEKKNRIVTEALGAGALSWVQNPHNLEDRNSLAKLLFTADCKDEVYARDVKQFQRTLVLPPSAGLRKHYAKAVYKFVSGRSFRGKWGGKLRRFAPPPQGGNLGLAALGRSSDFLNVMWLARKSSNKADLLKPKTPAYY